MEVKRLPGLLQDMRQQCSRTEKRILDYILEKPEDFISRPITEIAEELNTSPSAISRLCSKFRVGSIANFRVLLGQSVAIDRNINEPRQLSVDLKDSPENICRNILHFEQNQLSLFKDVIDVSALLSASNAMYQAKQIYIFGIGASAVVGLDLSHKMYRLQKKCFWSMDTDLQVMASQSMEKGDLAFCISYSGRSPAICKIAQYAKDNQIQNIGLYARKNSPLSRLVELSITSPFHDPRAHIGADVSRIHQLLVVDILCALLAAKDSPSALLALENTRAMVKKQ